MSDGHGSTPDTPPGWASNQPPPYGDAQGTPWAAPGSGPGGPSPSQPPPQYGQQHGQQQPPSSPPPPYQQHPGHHPGQQPYQGQPYPPGQPHPGQGYPPPPYGYQQPPPALRPGIIPLRPLGVGDVIDGAIKLIRSNPKAVLGLSAIAAALGAIPVAIGQALTFGRIGDAFRNNDPTALETTGQTDFLADYGGSLISYAVQFVAVTLLSGVLTRILGRAVFGGKITTGEAWRLTRGRVPTLFGLVAIEAGILLLPLAAVVGLLYATAVSGIDLGAFVLVMVLVMILYMVYAAFITTRLVLAAPAAVLEKTGVMASLSRSWRLTQGSFWRLFGILLLTSILAGLVGLVISVPFSFAAAFVGILVSGGTGVQILLAILLAIGGTVGAMITYPFQAGVYGLLYADRRMRAEAFDLVLQTAAIEQQRQGWVHASADDLWSSSATPGQPGQGAPWPGR
ncbi:glycerophosphoryl diester phosphodiesterase membrane domain-containing protein [Streptosporangium sp. NPDC020145]|uniref:glycerophosphoryl diester phosphodiesterase membrane domain-containing protein n=1 Tax=Streptosporangium sp. NPDC020145 TaxID=3154694 RepID=UPI003419554B